MSAPSMEHTPPAVAQFAAEFLYREAEYLDAQQWDEWLALYEPDVEFWIPSWRSEHVLTQNPRGELSLMYYRNRAGLEERVLRVRTGRSAASSPLPRTQHAIGNVRVRAWDERAMTIVSNWTLHEFQTRHQSVHVRFGRYEHQLACRQDRWLIAKKKVVILNDYLPAAVDFYSV